MTASPRVPGWAEAFAERFSRALSDHVAPVRVIVAVVLLVSAWEAVRADRPGVVGWTATMCLAIPIGVVLLLRRRGVVTSIRASSKGDRLVMLAVAVMMELLGLVVLRALGVPWPLWSFLVAFLAGIVAFAVANVVLRASGHVGVLATTAGASFVVYGAAVGVVAFLAAAGMGWSRRRVGAHSRLEVVVGLVLCGTVSLLTAHAMPR